MSLNEGVVLIEHFSRPNSGRHLHQSIFRRARIRALANDAQSLCHTQVVTVDTDRASS